MRDLFPQRLQIRSRRKGGPRSGAIGVSKNAPKRGQPRVAMTVSFLVLSFFGEETPHSIATSSPEENSGLCPSNTRRSGAFGTLEACEHG